MKVLTSRLRAYHAIGAVLLLSVAGCSSSASTTARNASAATSTPTSTDTSTPDTAVATSSDTATATSSAAAGTRTDDACALLTSDQVAEAVGTPGPYGGAHEDPASDGSPVWGCTWGTHESSADLRQVPASTFQTTPDPKDITSTPVAGIGDQARMDTRTPDGHEPELWFSVGGGYYVLGVTVSRSETDASNAGQEQAAEKSLAKLLVPKLSS